MEISTLCEADLVRNIMDGIVNGKDEETIVKEIQNPSFTVMTINMKGPSLRTPEHQRTLLSVILQLYPSAIIFCQEVPENFEEVVPDTANYFEPDCNKKTTAVICATEQFDSTHDLQIERILEEILETKKDEKLRSRISMVKLTTTQKPTNSTLAVSYHGPYTGFNKEKRSALLLHLLKFLNKVKVNNDIHSFIVGGDFNLDTTALEMKELPEKVEVGEYELSTRATRAKEKNSWYIPYKDNFFWSTEITTENIKALEGSAPFDHDPVVGELVFQPEKPRDNQRQHLKDVPKKKRSETRSSSSESSSVLGDNEESSSSSKEETNTKKKSQRKMQSSRNRR